VANLLRAYNVLPRSCFEVRSSSLGGGGAYALRTNATFSLPASFTLECWVYVLRTDVSASSTCNFLEIVNTGTNEALVWWELTEFAQSADVRLRCVTNAQASPDTTYSQLPPRQWRHLVVQGQPGVNSSKWSCYVDGIGKTPLTDQFVLTTPGPCRLRFRSSSASPIRFCNCTMSEGLLYPQTLGFAPFPFPNLLTRTFLSLFQLNFARVSPFSSSPTPSLMDIVDVSEDGGGGAGVVANYALEYNAVALSPLPQLAV
jgi:hypothetical protein